VDLRFEPEADKQLVEDMIFDGGEFTEDTGENGVAGAVAAVEVVSFLAEEFREYMKTHLWQVPKILCSSHFQDLLHCGIKIYCD
jgi:hypothetical protein